MPEKTKAILLASSQAHRTCCPGQVNANLDDQEGLGSLTTKWANIVAGRLVSSGQPMGDYGTRTFSASFSGSCYQKPASKFISVTTGGGRKMRFVITWQSHGFYDAGPDNYGTNDEYDDRRLSDIDLYVRTSRGALKDYSTFGQYNVEWVEWTVSTSEMPYQIEIRPYSWDCSLAQEIVGWAWVAWSVA